MAQTQQYLATAPLTFTSANSTSAQLVGTNLQYPSNLDTSNYYMMFQFVQYERPNIFSSGYNRAKGGVALPLPVQLKDSQSIGFTEEGNNPAVAGAVENAIASAGGSRNIAAKVLSGIGGAIAGGAAGLGLSQAQTAAASMGTSVNYGLSLTGVSVNPFLTVLFNSPKFKRHTFSWVFTPSNASDSKGVAAITNAFKYHSLPDLSGASAGTLLSYPDMLYISIYPENDYMYKFKPCVIENVTVDYAEQGPSFFTGTRAPTAVKFSIALLEIEYQLKKDYIFNGDGTVSQNIRS